jgi:hypothetical protein
MTANKIVFPGLLEPDGSAMTSATASGSGGCSAAASGIAVQGAAPAAAVEGAVFPGQVEPDSSAVSFAEDTAPAAAAMPAPEAPAAPTAAEAPARGDSAVDLLVETVGHCNALMRLLPLVVEGVERAAFGQGAMPGLGEALRAATQNIAVIGGRRFKAPPPGFNPTHRGPPLHRSAPAYMPGPPLAGPPPPIFLPEGMHPPALQFLAVEASPQAVKAPPPAVQAVDAAGQPPLPPPSSPPPVEVQGQQPHAVQAKGNAQARAPSRRAPRAPGACPTLAGRNRRSLWQGCWAGHSLQRAAVPSAGRPLTGRPPRGRTALD